MKKLFFFTAAIIILAGCGSGSQQAAPATETTAQEQKAPAIEILRQDITNTDFGITIAAVVKNNTDKKATYVGLTSVFTDSTDVIVGTGIGNTLDLEPGQTKTLEVLSTDDASNVAKYRVEVSEVYWEE